jgi:hypothetical protein
MMAQSIILVAYTMDGHTIIITIAIFPWQLKHIVIIVNHSTYHDVGTPHISTHHA